MEKIKTIFIFILIAFCLMQSCFITNQQYKRNKLLEHLEQNITQETYNHTLTSVIFDTVYQNKYIPYVEIDTVILTDTITDTITDTLYIKDTIQLPNQVSIKDTVFTDTVNNQIINNQLHIQISGYKPTIDTLQLNTSITSIKQHATRKKWFERITPSIGIGVGFNGRVGIFIGIGYRLY